MKATNGVNVIVTQYNYVAKNGAQNKLRTTKRCPE